MTDRCIDGRVMRHEPFPDDPEFERDVGMCPECHGYGCDQDLCSGGYPLPAGLEVCGFCGAREDEECKADLIRALKSPAPIPAQAE